MARAVRTFNNGCDCGKDHDSIEYLVASTLYDYAVGNTDYADEWEVGLKVAEFAEQVGWVKAGDEVEDLRILVDGMTGLDEVGHVEFPNPAHHSSTMQAKMRTNSDTSVENTHIALHGDWVLMVKWEEGQNPHTEDGTVVAAVRLDSEERRSLIEHLQSIDED